MVLVACLTPIIAVLQKQETKIVRRSTIPENADLLFAGGNIGEGPYFENYLRLKGIKFCTFVSGGMATFLADRKTDRKSVWENYRIECGVDLSKTKGNFDFNCVFPVKLNFGSGKTVSELLKEFSDKSLLREAVRHREESYHFEKTDLVLSIEYYIHPVILSNLKRGEFLSGTIVVSRRWGPEKYFLDGSQ